MQDLVSVRGRDLAMKHGVWGVVTGRIGDEATGPKIALSNPWVAGVMGQSIGARLAEQEAGRMEIVVDRWTMAVFDHKNVLSTHR